MIRRTDTMGRKLRLGGGGGKRERRGEGVRERDGGKGASVESGLPSNRSAAELSRSATA